MVIDDLHVGRTSCLPFKAKTPLFVYTELKKVRQSIMSNTKSTCEAASKTPRKKPNGLEDTVGLQVAWRMSEGSIFGSGGTVFGDQDKWIGDRGFAKTLEQLDLIVWIEALLADHTLNSRLS